MAKIYNMSSGTLMTINMENYSEKEFLVAAVDFLGCNPNSHKISISEQVFKECASSVLGKFLVAKLAYGDASGHADDELIVGYVPREQDVRYIRNKEGYLRGVVDAVISKQYAPEFCNIFTQANNTRSVSVEMGVEEEQKDKKETIAHSFNIMGITVLGMTVNPSSPGSTIDIKRFEEQSIQKDCEDYYKTVWQKLAEREHVFEGETYSINTKELKETPWGDVDKSKIRDAVMNASNRNELVKKVYLKVLDGWEDAPSENLKYPVMELIDNTFYYNRYALASALAYAKQHEETDVVSEVLKLYKKFDLIEEDEEENMSKKFEIEGREAWGEIIAEVQAHEGKDAYVDSVEKDHIIFTVDDVRYRVEADIEVDCDDKKVEADIYWDTKKEDKVQKEDEKASEDEALEDETETLEDEEMKEEPTEDSEDNSKDDDSKDDNSEDDMSDEGKEDSSEDNEGCENKCEDDKSDEMSDEEQKEDAKECSSDECESDKDKKIKELEDIIMAKDQELEELRKYKEEKECAERDFEVQQTLEELRECVDKETLEALKEEGLACKLSEIDGWKNKAKALAFDKNATKKEFTSVWSMAISGQTTRQSTSMWDNVN